MGLLERFIDRCAEDCVNGSRTRDPNEYDHGAYCMCPDCEPDPAPVSQFDRVRQAKEAMRARYQSAKWHARHLIGTPFRPCWMQVSRQLAWQELCQAIYWRDRLEDIADEGHGVRR